MLSTTMLSLQTMLFFSLINTPKVPVKLSMLYEKLGFISFEFLPNVITGLFSEDVTKSTIAANELTDNAKHHPNIF